MLESIRVDVEIESPRSVERIRLLEELTGLYDLEEKFALAAQAARDALDVRRSIYGENSAEVVDGLTFIAFSQPGESRLFASRRNLAAAQATAEEATELARTHLSQSAPAAVRAWLALSEVLREAGDVEGADEILEKHVEPFGGEALDEVLEPVVRD